MTHSSSIYIFISISICICIYVHMLSIYLSITLSIICINIYTFIYIFVYIYICTWYTAVGLVATKPVQKLRTSRSLLGLPFPLARDSGKVYRVYLDHPSTSPKGPSTIVVHRPKSHDMVPLEGPIIYLQGPNLYIYIYIDVYIYIYIIYHIPTWTLWVAYWWPSKSRGTRAIIAL